MPIEIKELHIHVVVNAFQSEQSSTRQQVSAGGSGSVGNSNDEKEAIIAECVEQVLQILQNKQER